jgi:oxygen-independent coproporphyrinogen-3 oxidase
MNALPALGLYVHIPFCERKCPYCDFNTYAGLQASFQDLVDALCGELARWREPLAGRTVATIFVGGGTPTVLTAAQLEQIFGAIHANFQIDADAEITCEANPGTVDREKFTVLRRLGVNRLSMGVQSFQPDELAFLGRIHDVQDVYLAYDAARAAGFGNINLDFIFGLPQQVLAAWDETLTRALALAPEHLSLYSLIVEPETPLHRWVETGKTPAPDDDLAADHYERAMARLADSFAHYEVSNWSRRTAADGDATTPTWACRHNLLYWQNADYLGIGPGAHSHLRQTQADGGWLERRWGNRRPVAGYIQRIRRGQDVAAFTETIGARLAMGETMMTGLRLLRTGVPDAHFAALHGVALRDAFGATINRLAARGLVAWCGDALRLTPAGLMLGNQVFAEFLPDEPTAATCATASAPVLQVA